MERADALATSVVDVLWATLIAQRARWGTLLGHGRGNEIWWRSEFALALESWCWSSEAPEDLGVLAEAKPARAGLKPPSSDAAVDLLVCPWRDDRLDISASPRVWVELKERATWWSEDPAKAFGTANHGLLHDLAKWMGTDWPADDHVLAVQLVAHLDETAKQEEILPDRYRAFLDKHVGDRRFAPPRSVGWPTPTGVRWLTMEVVTIHGSQLGDNSA